MKENSSRPHSPSAPERSKGQIEAAITAAVSRFERDFLGRGPKDAQAFIIRDMVLVRLLGILNPAEQQLSLEPGGVELLKQIRNRLIENLETVLKEIIGQETGLEVASIHTDISVRTGERMFLFILTENLEQQLREGPSPKPLP